MLIADALFYLIAIPVVLLSGISKTGIPGLFGGMAVPLLSLVISPGAKFGPVSVRSAGLKTAMRKLSIGIEISPGISDAIRKVRKEVRNRRVGILGKKKGLTNLELVGHRKLCWLS